MYSHVLTPKLVHTLVSFFVLVSLINAQVLGERFCNKVRRKVIESSCRECSYNSLRRCHSSYNHLTPGIGIQGTCNITLRYPAWTVTVRGCYHQCARNVTYRDCCDGFWGHDCKACPGNPVCSAAGTCVDKKSGNGTCRCRDGFKGTACELCTDLNKFGPSCSKNCTCQYGRCDSGVKSTGQCKPYTCRIGYTGKDCSERLPLCHHNISCGANADCFHINGSDTCICDPGYRGNGQVCTAINPCNESAHGCHANANCVFTSPGRHRCECHAGYTGDGNVCMVIDPCQTGNGGCPANSTSCSFLGPDKSNCSCLPGFNNYQAAFGCSLVDLCNDGNKGGCDVNADCIMFKPGQKRCVCKDGFRGNLNETHCYGNIIQRVKNLNTSGPPGVRGLISMTLQILEHELARALAVSGPFTIFVPVDTGIYSAFSPNEIQQILSNHVFAGHIARLHIVAADLDSVKLKAVKMVTTLQGTNATITVENGSLYYHVQGQNSKARIIASDMLAGNGIVHIIDKAMRYPGDYVQYSPALSILEVIQRKNQFSTISSLLQLSGVASQLTGLSLPVTVFAPSNDAFNTLDNVTMRYLTTTDKGKHKLVALLKNHIIGIKIKIESLIIMNKLTTIEGGSVIVKRHSQGLVVLGQKGNVVQTDIAARDGVLHMIDNLLIPSDILPLIPKYCNRISYRYRTSLCYHCNLIDSFPNRGCPQGYQPSVSKTACNYHIFYGRGWYQYVGCRTSLCRRRLETPECCSGYYGRVCHPCPGPLDSACNGNGRCLDKIAGSGRCYCQRAFSGTACEMCSTSGKFGAHCNQTCSCIHGTCSDGIHGNGTCKSGTCLDGFHGNNCDMRDTTCAISSPIRCHIHAHCVSENRLSKCKCNLGYEGSGQRCYEIDPCTKSGRGGCDVNAICRRTGPGINNCTCQNGYRGDGRVCVVIDPCVEADRGGCHDSALCQYIAPGQSICTCKSGYTGSGEQCSEINNCLVNNGGCSSKARCIRTGPASHNCTCTPGYIGNGYSCLPSIATVVETNSNLQALFDVVKKAHMMYYLSNPTVVMTLFAPSSLAIAVLSRDDRTYWTASTDRMEHLIKYHLANGLYSASTLKNITTLTVTNGLSLSVKNQSGQVILNNNSRVIQADIGVANGVVHIINQVLLPPRLPPTPLLPNVSELLKSEAELSDFYNISTQYISQLDSCDACTIFAPTNQALRYFRQHNALSLYTLKYHVIRKYIKMANVYNGQQFTTDRGANYLVKITDGSKVNGISFDTRMLKARKSVIYRLNGVLVPVKSRCDVRSTNYRTFFNPLRIPRCPWGWRRLWGYCRYYGLWCYARCVRTVTTRKCCNGFWGIDCQACPGNVTSPCLGNGRCSDGLMGTGHCNCSTNFTGTECEKCVPPKYGKTCSSRCECVHGLCNGDVTGDGSCTCDHGWKGKRCDQSANYTLCLPTKCHRHSSCHGSGASARCVCDADYTGNGTYCRVIHPCERNNGGCHSKAACQPNPTHPSQAVCTCLQGYAGDGQYCEEIDLCQAGNGGCHVNATCASTGPATRSCHCKAGFTGDGVIRCTEFNPCDYANGGCDVRAYCKKTGPGQRKCTCADKYVGDGVTCVGSSMEVIEKDPDLSKVSAELQKYGLDKLLTSQSQTSMMAPTNEAFQRLGPAKRKRRSVSSPLTVDQYLRYHMVSCTRMTNDTLAHGARFTSLLGPPIWLVNNGSQLYFRDANYNTARVTQLYESSNGFIFKLDKLLEPPHIQTKHPQLSFLEAANKLGYTTSAGLLNGTEFEGLLSSVYGRPYLVFFLSNEAYDKLSDEFKSRITKPENLDELTKYVKYHIVPNAPANFSTDFLVRGGGGVELRTMAGETIFLSCRGGKGDLYVNGRSKIIQRDIQFDGGVAYGVDTVLLPLGLGGKCDKLMHDTVNGSCGSCFAAISCPTDTTLVGTTNERCIFDGDSLGCQPLCLRRRRVHKCCSNYYGADCQACPGGRSSPCSGRGHCDDGLTGAGQCRCRSPYLGTACERCPDNVRCPAPVSCSVNSGGCHVLATCSGAPGHVNCTCNSGYQGDGYYCQVIDRCNINNGGCGENATCHFQGPGQSRCQCMLGYHMVGVKCVGHAPQSLCAVNHGGCSPSAGCSDTSGRVVCTCLTGYTGDGITCEGNIVQVLENTIKVKEFYKALHAVRVSGEGSILFTKLQSTVVNFTVFAPINSAVGNKKFKLQLLKHHIVAGRVSLSRVSDGMTLTTLLGSKLMIRNLTNGEVSVNGVAHVKGDIDAFNGIIHVLDQVLPIVGPVPPQPTTPPPTTTPTTTAPPPTTTPTSTASPHTAATISSTPTPQTTQESTKQPTITVKPGVIGKRKGKEEGLSSGGIAGIVIVLVLVLAAMAGVILFCRKRRHPLAAFKYTKEEDTLQYNSEAFDENGASYENPMYGDVSVPGPSRITVHHENIDMPVVQTSEFDNPLYMLDDTEGKRIAEDSPPTNRKTLETSSPFYETVNDSNSKRPSEDIPLSDQKLFLGGTTDKDDMC